MSADITPLRPAVWRGDATVFFEEEDMVQCNSAAEAIAWLERCHCATTDLSIEALRQLNFAELRCQSSVHIASPAELGSNALHQTRGLLYQSVPFLGLDTVNAATLLSLAGLYWRYPVPYERLVVAGPVIKVKETNWTLTLQKWAGGQLRLIVDLWQPGRAVDEGDLYLFANRNRQGRSKNGWPINNSDDACRDLT